MSNRHRYVIKDDAGVVCRAEFDWNHGGESLTQMLGDVLSGSLPRVPEDTWTDDPERFGAALAFLVEHRERLESIAVMDEYGEVVTPAVRDSQPEEDLNPAGHEVKPCPFCGSRDAKLEGDRFGPDDDSQIDAFVVCPDCRACGPFVMRSAVPSLWDLNHMASHAWNEARIGHSWDPFFKFNAQSNTRQDAPGGAADE